MFWPLVSSFEVLELLVQGLGYGQVAW